MSDTSIIAFKGQYAFLSNFYVEPDGTTVEHEFAAAKTHDLREKATIMEADLPGQAKKLGRKATLRPDWEEVKVQVMRDLVFRKFFDHQELAVALLGTGDAELVEGNYWHDNFWGVCTCDACGPKRGQNFLGQILMEIRDVIAGFSE